MDILSHLHSGLRWVVLFLLLAAIVQAFAGMSGNRPFNRKLALYALISVHTQIVIGLIIYFAGSWYQQEDRFFRLEHIMMMLIAALLITIGNARAKRGATDKAKYKSIAVFFTLGLFLILVSIPWPFMQRFSAYGWF